MTTYIIFKFIYYSIFITYIKVHLIMRLTQCKVYKLSIISITECRRRPSGFSFQVRSLQSFTVMKSGAEVVLYPCDQP